MEGAMSSRGSCVWVGGPERAAVAEDIESSNEDRTAAPTGCALQLTGTVCWFVQGRGGVCAQQVLDAEWSPCSKELLCELMDLRSLFETWPRGRYSAARKLCNRSEGLSRAEVNPFLNRSALKLVNLDCLTQNALSQPGKGRTELSFVDLCGGPGGFTEYLLRRCEVEARRCVGWGITLNEPRGGASGACAWDTAKLESWLTHDDDGTTRKKKRRTEDVSSATTGMDIGARRFTICHGSDGTGNLLKPENLTHFVEQVIRENQGSVDVVVADGGFEDARSRFDQEEVMLPLIISQVLAMCHVLREGGCFVCKLFDVTLPATVQVIAMLAQSFERIALVKPVTTRPASSERYVACLRRGPCEAETAEMLESMLRGGGVDSASALSAPVAREKLSVLRNGTFRRWLRGCNDAMLRQQRDACQEIVDVLQMDGRIPAPQAELPPAVEDLSRMLGLERYRGVDRPSENQDGAS